MARKVGAASRLAMCFVLASSTLMMAEEEKVAQHIALGDRFASQGLITQAVQEYEAALHAGGGSSKLLNRLGQLYMEWGSEEDARASFRNSLVQQPDQIPVLVRLGETFLMSGRVDSAIYYVKQARKLSSDSSGLHGRLGALYIETGELSRARAHLDTALTLNPNNPDAHRFLGLYFSSWDSTDLALAEYEKVIELVPDDLEAHNNIAFLHAQTGKLSQALSYYGQVKELAHDPLLNHAVNLRMEAIRAILNGKMRARIILVDTMDRAQEMLQELQSGGKFAELAQKFSTAPNASDGGDEL